MRRAGRGISLQTGSAGPQASFARASQWWWAGLFAAVALWEIFLRADSRVLAAATKVWLFPLLLVTFSAWGSMAGTLIGMAVSALAGPLRARRLYALVFAAATAAAVTLEFALMAYHHAPGMLRAWPAVAALSAAAALVLSWVLPGAAGHRSGEDGRALSRRLTMLVTVAATVGLATALTRADVATAFIKRQSAFGRLLGHGLALVPPRLPPPVESPSRLPELRAAHALGRANVILLSVDTLRHDALGVYSHVRGASPAIDAFATHAVVFDDTYTQSPNSAPSMATVLTGLYPFRHGLRYNRMALATAAPTLPEILAGAGYATAAFVTNVTLSEPFRFQRGFASFRYLPSQEREDGLMLDSSDPQAVDAALAWVRDRPEHPFLLWVHLMAPHWPYLPPADLRPDLGGWHGPWFNVLNMSAREAPLAHQRPPFDHGVYTRLYAAEVASADRLCERLLRGLEDLHVLDSAHVVLIADHGEAFGESDVFGHGRSLDQAETRVPLVWRLPGALRGGARITTTVQLADLAPTLLRLLGLPAPANLDGRDVSALVLGDAAGDDGFAFTEARYLQSMGVRGLLYAARTRRRMLWLDAGYPYAGAFDRTIDPEERDHRGQQGEDLDPLYDTLVALAASAQTTLAAPPARVKVDAEAERRLRALGYVQ